MKKSCQIAILALWALVAASSFNCLSIATMTMTLENKHLISTSSFVLVTNAPYLVSIMIIDNLINHMTISITNVYETQLSLFFLSNVDDLAPMENSLAIVLLNNSSTQYAFLTR